MAHHFEQEYAHVLRQCIKYCEEIIDLCQQTISICPTSSDTDCAERCAKLTKHSNILLNTAKSVINLGNDHIRICENNTCINACEKAIKDCRHVMTLCSNIINQCSSNTNECTTIAKESISHFNRCSHHCSKALEFA